MLELRTSDKALEIFFKKEIILKHSNQQPAFIVGNGNCTYEMYHGNFDITDELESKYPLDSYEVLESGRTVSRIKFFNKLAEIFIRFEVHKNNLLQIIPEIESPNLNRFWIRLSSTETEAIYGGGEQYSKLNLKGSKLPIWVSEQGVGRNKNELLTFFADKYEKAGGDWYTTYYPQPSFITSSNKFCHVDNTSYMTFDFSHKDYTQIECYHQPHKIVIGVEDDFLKTVQKQSEYFGRQPELPDWVFNGMILGLQGGTKTVKEKIELALKKDIALSAIWIQDWQGKRITSFGKQLMWNWEFEESMYPELPETIKELRKKGIRTLGYINPFLAIEGSLYKQAHQKGYTLKKPNGEEYLVVVTTFPAAIVDLTNPNAFEWLKGIIKENMIGIGLSGWMADFGEYTPCDCAPFSGEDARLLHNKFPVLWAQLNREAVEESDKLGEIVFFMRAGYSFTQRYSTLMWNGDQMVDWSLDDGLASVIPASLSLGLSGFGISHSDIGGYTTFDNQLGKITRSKELFMRWAEHAAFTPIMRTHEGNQPDLNCQFDFDDETLEHLSNMVSLHVKLKPYLKTLSRENSETGLPFMRSLYTHYPSQETKDIQYEYLLGRDMLVSPVIKEGETEHTVFLPNDEWIYLWDETTFNGGTHIIHSPLGKVPVFIRKDSQYKETLLKIKEVE